MHCRVAKCEKVRKTNLKNEKKTGKPESRELVKKEELPTSSGLNIAKGKAQRTRGLSVFLPKYLLQWQNND